MILFLGDSITARWSKESFEQFKKYGALNLALDGACTQYILHILTTPIVNDDSLVTSVIKDQSIDLKCVVLMVGINNIKRDEEPIDEIFAQIKAIIEIVSKLYPKAKILLRGLLPSSPMGSDPIRKRILSLNKLLASLKGDSVMFIDSYNSFINIK